MYFCQSLVMTVSLSAGIGAGAVVQDRHGCPSIEEDNALAVYVDGAAVVGLDSGAVNADGAKVEKALTAANLPCKGLVATGDLQTFTGLDFRRSTAHITVTAHRLWKVRLCLQYSCYGSWATSIGQRF